MARTGSRCRTACRTRRCSWVVVQKQAHDLVVSTYGRGFYIMEDITPLEQGVIAPRPSRPRCSSWRPAPASASRAAARAEFTFKLTAAPKAPVEVRSARCQGRAGSQAARP